MKVLVVDDEPSLLRLLQMTLETEGYDVLLASDGETAMKRIDQERPDLLLLDVMMPVVDGWHVLEQLRDQPRRLRIICLTAKDSRRDVIKGWRLGADDYLTKPFEVDDLLELIRDVMQRSPTEQTERRRSALEELGASTTTD